MQTFITNSDGTNQTDYKNLAEYINEFIKYQEELKFLVGFFYFSGLKELYQSLQINEKVVLKILVGLNVDTINKFLVEIPFNPNSNDEEKVDNFFQSIKKSFNSDNFDNKEFYEQAKFFLGLIKEDRLIIRKTEKPNHAKLYIFQPTSKDRAVGTQAITGSSNLTSAGLVTQDEFNIKFIYEMDKTIAYFDNLWDKSIEITEKDELKTRLINIIENDTFIKSISPFEAYCYIIKSYAESYTTKKADNEIIELLEKNDYRRYQYQIDAIEQALSIIDLNNGVLIADVVGLGKSIIASCVAKSLNKRGLILCPPGLIGDENNTSGWRKYREEFALHDWEVKSSGDLDNIQKFLSKNPNKYEVVIIDEVHKFRNQDTESYEKLLNICRNKQVILLTATPFNNAPSDLLSLLKLFIIPKKSSITLDDNLERKFNSLQYEFKNLSFILKNHNSSDSEKIATAKKRYKAIFGNDNIQLSQVKNRISYLAKQIRDIVEPVTIRRNRLDLTSHFHYKNEITDLSIVEDPKEYYYEFTKEQSNFYDRVINNYFASPENNGRFTGAIYRPFEYEQGYAGIDINDEKRLKKLDLEDNREFNQQRNLFDIMRRMIVKRFESSFGAFRDTINRFIEINQNVIAFIEKRGDGDVLKGEYILYRKLIEKVITNDSDNDEIDELLDEYILNIAKGVYPKNHKIYKISKFNQKKEFISDIQSDIKLLKGIKKEIEDFQLTEDDPKSQAMFEHFDDLLANKDYSNEPKRKILIFSEYADTVKFIKEKLEKKYSKYNDRTLFIHGSISKEEREAIEENFNASYNEKDQKDKYDIIITTDKLSEGFNLNRAGVVINYDIPWNPVRVIQRVGRINRIGKKIFDKLMIVNFFPTEKGADYVRSRQIAENKMFMIHNTLGEDTKIFDADEEPSASEMFNRINQNPDANDEVNIYTQIVNLYESLKEKHPEVFEKIKDLPARIKTGKFGDENEMLLFIRKNRMYVKLFKEEDGKLQAIDPLLEDVIKKIECDIDTKSIPINSEYWDYYEQAKMYKEEKGKSPNENSTEVKALNNLKNLKVLKKDLSAEIYRYVQDLFEIIVEYGTLADATLRRLSNLEMKNIKECEAVIRSIIDDLGENYIQDTINSSNIFEKEIIIGYMNRTYIQEEL